MPRRRRPRPLAPRERAVAALLVGLASLLWFWPLPLGLASQLVVEPDPFLASAHEVWLAWLLRATPLDQLLALETRLVLPPDGVDLRYYHEWMTAGVGALVSVLAESAGLARPRSLVLGVNLAGIAALALSAGAVARSARPLGASRGAEALAVLALLCSPVLRTPAALVNAEQLWVGLVLLAVHALVMGQGGPLRRGLVAGAAGLLAGLATRYLFLATAGAVVVVGAGALVLRERRTAQAAGLALVLLALVGIALGWPQLTAPAGAAALESARPVVPGPLDLLLPRVVYDPTLTPSVENHAYSAYVGLTLLGLGLRAAWRGGPQERLLCAAGGGLLIAGMGWETAGGLPLPLRAVAAVVPVIENLHAPHRLVLSGQVLLAPLVGLGLGGRALALGALGLVVEGLVAARGLVPFPTAPLPGPSPLLADLAAAPGAVAELATDDDLRSSHHLDLARQVRQLHHGQPLLQMPSWPGGGVEPAVPGLDPAVRHWATNAVLALDPSRPGVVALPVPSPLDEAGHRGLRWLLVLVGPTQAGLRTCALDLGVHQLRCSAVGPAEAPERDTP